MESVTIVEGTTMKDANKTVLLTGGAGYIGSHAAVELLEAGHEVVVVDNLSNSSAEALSRVEQITGKSLVFYPKDLRDSQALNEIMARHHPHAVMHFAGLKAVGESVAEPLRYYANNLDSTLVLLEAMRAHGVCKLVFSSSATVYGDPASLPIREDFPTAATNPYGRTKLFIEEILKDTAHAWPQLAVAILRYFNPVGAHPSGLMGEDPNGIPNNLMPYISQVAVGRRERLQVFGNDYPTPDGTGVRDYIHVVDLVRGHLAALAKIESQTGVHIWNLGTGRGYSVLEVIRAFETASGRAIPYEVVARRPGDVAACYADPSKAATELDWHAEFDIQDMCRDAWRWQLQNPDGY
jgi:UDP-glucose 4-epimerase